MKPAQRKAAHEITRAGKSAGLVAQTHIHVLAELPPRIPPTRLGLVAGGQILPRAEAVDHIGGVELLAVKPQPDQHVVGIVKSRVVSLRHVGTERVAREAVTRREEDARTDRTNVARTPSPDVDALRLGQVGGVAVDQIILRLDVVVGDAQFVVGRQDELLAYADAQARCCRNRGPPKSWPCRTTPGSWGCRTRRRCLRSRNRCG